jgi:PIN domain nuclease of toxin-antitoxin system
MSRTVLDTQVLLWSMYRPQRLPLDIAAVIKDKSNELHFSAVSIWEIAIKRALGRPGFDVQPGEAISDALAMGFLELPVRAAAAARVATLPLIHKDPFDRLLIAQSMHLPAIFLTADRVLQGYSELVKLFSPR